MKDLRPTLLVFDCDGTLIDSQHAIVSSMVAAFASRGLAPPARREILQQVGLVLDRCVENLLPVGAEDEREAVAAAYRAHYGQLRAEGRLDAPLFPGTAEMLRSLQERGFLLAVATGMSRRGLNNTLEEHQLSDLFVATRTADEAPSKPHPQMLEDILDTCGVEAPMAWMLGDTTYDIEMARNAKVAPVAVTWGYHQPDALQAAGARWVLRTWDELLVRLTAS